MMSRADLLPYTQSLHVLYVEDDEMVREIHTRMLVRLFKSIELASDGQEGLEKAQSGQYDIIISDIRMPKMTGITMCREIKEQFPEQHIIITSASDDSDGLIELIDIGVDHFILKPIERDKLNQVIYRIAKQIYDAKMADIYRSQLEEINQYNKIEQEKAHRKQRNMITNDLENDPSFKIQVVYRPSDILSGDSYSIHRRLDGSLLLYLADGMGHGILPSLTVFAVASSVRRFLYGEMDFEEFSSQFVEMLKAILDDEEQLSCIFMQIDSTYSQVRYFNAGMYPAMLHDGKQLHSFASNNMPFMGFDRKIRVDTVEIAGLERLFLYSDGLIEESGEDLSFAEMRTMMKNVDHLRTHLEEAVSSDRSDDTTAIFIEKS